MHSQQIPAAVAWGLAGPRNVSWLELHDIYSRKNGPAGNQFGKNFPNSQDIIEESLDIGREIIKMVVVKVLPSRQAPWPMLTETLGHPPSWIFVFWGMCRRFLT